MTRTAEMLAGAAALGILTGCSDFDTTRERSALLNSPGPVITDAEVNSYLRGLTTIRRFYAQTATFSDDTLELPDPPATAGTIPDAFTQARLGHTRTLILAYIDSRCDAYLDAIFWANRTRHGVSRGNNAIGSAVGTILGATGTPTNVMGMVAAAFGLSGNLFDAYYASVLYELDPSGVRHLVDQAQLAFRARLPADVESEAALLEQVQGYIRQCTPSHIDFLVGSALKKAGVVAQTPVDVATILFLDKWQIKADGTVVDPNGKAIPLGGPLAGAPFELLDNGRVRIGGRTIDYKAAGLASWGKIPGAGEAATGLVPRTDGPAVGATGRSTIRTDIGG